MPGARSPKQNHSPEMFQPRPIPTHSPALNVPSLEATTAYDNECGYVQNPESFGKQNKFPDYSTGASVSTYMRRPTVHEINDEFDLPIRDPSEPSHSFTSQDSAQTYSSSHHQLPSNSGHRPFSQPPPAQSPSRKPAKRRPVSTLEERNPINLNSPSIQADPFPEHSRRPYSYNQAKEPYPFDSSNNLNEPSSPPFRPSYSPPSGTGPRGDAFQILNGEHPNRTTGEDFSSTATGTGRFSQTSMNVHAYETYRNSTQTNVQDVYDKNQRMSANFSPNSVRNNSQPSYIQKESNSYNADWRQEKTVEDKPSQMSPQKSRGNSLAADISPTPSQGPAESNGPWKYHIQKNLKDFYLTTNPDSDHIKCPVGPSYYVDIQTGSHNSFGQISFTMTLVNPILQFCEIKIERGFVIPHDEEYFEITVFKKTSTQQSEFDSNPSLDEHRREENNPSLTAEVSPPGMPQVAWKSRAIGIKAPSLDDVNSSRFKNIGKRPSVRQFMLQDEKGRKWIVGNRTDRSDGFYEQDEDDENESLYLDQPLNGNPVKKRSTKVYFFAPGHAGPETDKIMAVLQRRKQLHKKIMKDISKLSLLDDRVTDYDYESEKAGGKHRSFFKSTSKDPPSMAKSTFGTAQDGGRDDRLEEEEDAAKFGWLTLYENVKKRQGMWPIVTGLTLAVSYSQRMDTKEKSVGEKFKKLGRKYRESRMQVLHRHTQSSV